MLRLISRSRVLASNAARAFSQAAAAPSLHTDLSSQAANFAVKGRIHSIETGTCVDGKGVRFLLFTQGCARRCAFCANPDTWNPKEGKEVSVKEIAQRISRYKNYMRNNEGGVTLSGGEPLMQPDFTRAVFEETHRMGLTTTLDTSGWGTRQDWNRILPHVDTVLLCLKSMNTDTYWALTESDPTKAFQFLRSVMAHKKKLWLRWVLLPGWTDTEQELNALYHLIQSLDPKLFQGIELLPFHTLGIHKWQALGLSNKFHVVTNPLSGGSKGTAPIGDKHNNTAASLLQTPSATPILPGKSVPTQSKQKPMPVSPLADFMPSSCGGAPKLNKRALPKTIPIELPTRPMINRVKEFFTSRKANVICA